MIFFAKKHLGQHFLNSSKAIQAIIDASNIQESEKVLEIGPGKGVLTRAILAKKALLLAVEKDLDAVNYVQAEFAHEITTKQLELVHGDILELRANNDSSLNKTLNDGCYALIANIPYYITGAILESFLEHVPRPNRAVLLVQKEVADRIIGRDNKESILSIAVKAFGQPKIIEKVPRGAFNPPPKVDSAIISIENISDSVFKSHNIPINKFFEVVKTGFAHKRKVLINNLEVIFEKNTLLQVWNSLNIDPKTRAEDVDIDKWFEIIKLLINKK
jgi:16S rRNA (adenine1518-N6/adenine1519-N6)-dimethyltransferase